MNPSLTATALEKMRQRAKQQARERAIPYSHALEDEAKSAGFASWHDVRRAARPPAPPAAPQSADLPVDPLLPRRFDDTPNERRSKAELDAWWLRPFAQSRGDGTFDVRCLDGGAHDRATYYGTAADLAQARELALSKLDRWLAVRDSPVPLILDGEVEALLTLEPNRPGMARPVLAAAGSMADLPMVLGRWKELRERDPKRYALHVRAARERSAQVPPDAQVELALERAGDYGLTHPDGALPDFSEVAVLLTLHRFAQPAGSEVQFMLSELAQYLYAFGLDEDSIGPAFARVRDLQLEGRPAIVEANTTVHDGAEHWRVRLAITKWPQARRRRKG